MADEKEFQEGCSPEACSSCSHASSCGQKPQSFLEDQNVFSSIKHVFGIVSGKGGVGKSFVTGSLAVELARKGYKVGILDADITGQSIQKMFGITGGASGDDNGIYPAEAAGGIKIMSINMLLEDDTTPVIWRGPVLAGVVKQFWTDVIWGELDYLLVDMPPGTGDVPLTVFQSLPVEGIVIVTSPQSLVNMIVTKAYNMAKQMNIPVVGVVENYSYLECPDCGRRISLFGESHIDEIAAKLGVPVLGKMPIRPELNRLADEGHFSVIHNEMILDAVEALEAAGAEQ